MDKETAIEFIQSAIALGFFGDWDRANRLVVKVQRNFRPEEYQELARKALDLGGELCQQEEQ